MKARSIRVSGKVQGVYFRQSTRDKALELGVKGFVRNDPDGSVYIEAEGEETAMQLFEIWCSSGPRLARVDKVQAVDISYSGYSIFEVRR